MQTRDVHTVILGAGPSGLAAGYTLAKAGKKPIVVDRDREPGGLMRSIHHKDFVVDVGRKELYNRLAKVDDFWESVIGEDYRPYPHRGGYLYDGLILEMSRAYAGFRRGMSWPMFLGCIGGFVWGRLNVLASPPRNVEEYFYKTRGRLLTRVASQGFQEKLAGKRWADIPLPPDFKSDSAGFITTVKDGLARSLTTQEVNTYKGIWRHPAKGTGQICDALAAGITGSGGEFAYGAKILELKTSGNKVESVTAEVNGEPICYNAQNVISTIPLEALLTLLGRPIPAAYTAARGAASQRRSVVLVYLFLNREPKFPHAWLQVTDSGTRIGRITNYAGFNSDMVPAGKGCVCCEYYCFGADPLLEVPNEKLVQDTLDYCANANLIDRTAVTDNIVMKLPGADASQNRHNWITSLRLGLLDEVGVFRNLYYAGRTDLDIATLAGLESAEAVLTGDRATFDLHLDPEKLGIRSVRKAFEFKLPVAG